MPKGNFNWMALRVLVRRKQHERGMDCLKAAEAAGMNRGAYTGFLNGNRPTLTTDNTLRLLAWLEIYDWREFWDE
jgi:hypothetical protein